jgi:hypothetical protein
MLLRQYTRAAIFVLMSRLQLFASKALVVPLTTWSDQATVLGSLDPDLGTLPPRLIELERLLHTMMAKLDVFDAGLLGTPISATRIMEAIAFTIQGRAIHQVFGGEASSAFTRELGRGPQYDQYVATLESLFGALGPMPVSATLLLLTAALCGNFQDPDENRPRYPADLFIVMVEWMRRQHIQPGRLTGLDEVYQRVDDFFEAVCGNDLQSNLIQAAKANHGVEEVLRARVAEVEERAEREDLDLRRALHVFENFKVMAASFGAMFSQNPEWYCSEAYVEDVRALPRPPIYLLSERGVIVSPNVRDAYIVGAGVSVGDPQEAELAFVLSPNSAPARLRSDLGAAIPFSIPDTDLEAWLAYHDSVIPLLRLLTAGTDGMPPVLLRPTLAGFALAQTKVYNGVSRAPVPAMAEVASALLGDPDAADMLVCTPGFREWLTEVAGEPAE